MIDLRFPHHSKEKLEELNYYYKVWFGIVKLQKCYIIDAYAGTGYVTIKESEERILGSALLAVDLFKNDIQKNLDVVLININPVECKTLRNNIETYLLENKIDAELDSSCLFFSIRFISLSVYLLKTFFFITTITPIATTANILIVITPHGLVKNSKISGSCLSSFRLPDPCLLGFCINCFETVISIDPIFPAESLA